MRIAREEGVLMHYNPSSLPQWECVTISNTEPISLTGEKKSVLVDNYSWEKNTDNRIGFIQLFDDSRGKWADEADGIEKDERNRVPSDLDVIMTSCDRRDSWVIEEKRAP